MCVHTHILTLYYKLLHAHMHTEPTEPTERALSLSFSLSLSLSLSCLFELSLSLSRSLFLLLSLTNIRAYAQHQIELPAEYRALCGATNSQPGKEIRGVSADPFHTQRLNVRNSGASTNSHSGARSHLSSQGEMGRGHWSRPVRGGGGGGGGDACAASFRWSVAGRERVGGVSRKPLTLLNSRNENTL
jgi:hypothetical protein